MISIKSPLQLNDSNPAVANLQDALLALWENSIFRAFEAPNSPTQEELDKLAEGIREEREKPIFGEATRQLILYFQLQAHLGDNLHGVVEEKTADRLNEILKKLGLIEDEPLPSCVVGADGVVVVVDGALVAVVVGVVVTVAGAVAAVSGFASGFDSLTSTASVAAACVFVGVVGCPSHRGIASTHGSLR